VYTLSYTKRIIEGPSTGIRIPVRLTFDTLEATEAALKSLKSKYALGGGKFGTKSRMEKKTAKIEKISE
jgi:hypothetical protein